MTPAERQKHKRHLATARRAVASAKRNGHTPRSDMGPLSPNAKVRPELVKARERRLAKRKKVEIPSNIAPVGKAPRGDIAGDDERLERLVGHQVAVRLVPRAATVRGAEIRGQLAYVDEREIVIRQIARRHIETPLHPRTLALHGAVRCKTERIDLRIERKKIQSACVALEDVETPPIQP